MSSRGAIRSGRFYACLVLVSGFFGPDAFSAGGEVHLAWDSARFADGYYVQRSTQSGGPYTTVSSRLTTLAFTDRGLDVGTPYYYVVVAENAYGRSPPSSEVRAVPPGDVRPAAPTGLSATPGEGFVALDWSDNAESNLVGYHVFRSITRGGPYEAIRSFVSASEYTDRSLLAGVSYYYIVTAVDSSLTQSSPSIEVAATTIGSAWTAQDIGDVATAGLFVDLRTTVLIAGSGSNIGNASDEFHYVFRELEGDGEIRGRFISLQHTHESAKVGFMMRETLGSGSKNVLMCVTSQSGAIFQRRSATGGASEVIARPAAQLPRYLRLSRSGDKISAYSSTDGATWTGVGSTTLPMSRRIFVGIAITSHNDGALTSAWVDNISQSGSSPPPDNVPPAAPSGLRGTAGDGFVDLDWANNTEPDLAGYNVYRGAAAGGPYSLIASALAISAYTDASVTNGTTYHYVVTATDGVSNESTYSGDVSVKPMSAQPPPGGPLPPPVLLAATAGDGSVDLDWIDSTEPSFSNYRVYRSTTPGPPYFRLASGLTASRHTDGAVTNGTTYYYTITALNSAGLESTYSNERSARPSASAPPPPPPVGPLPPPVLLAATAGDGSVDLDWTDRTEPSFTSYRVYRSTTPGPPYFRLASDLTASRHTDQAATNGKTYYYTITALDTASLESVYSNELSATPTAIAAAVEAVYQAEDALVVGPEIIRNHPAVPGVDFVDYLAATGDYIEWTVTVTRAGVHTLEFRYSLVFGNRPLEVLVNGSVVESALSFPGTGSWTTWATVSTTATLRAGANTVRAVAIGLSGGNIDYLRVTGG